MNKKRSGIDALAQLPAIAAARALLHSNTLLFMNEDCKVVVVRAVFLRRNLQASI